MDHLNRISIDSSRTTPAEEVPTVYPTPYKHPRGKCAVSQKSIYQLGNTMYLITTILSSLVVSSKAFLPMRPVPPRASRSTAVCMTAEAYPGALPPMGYFDPWYLARSRTPAEVSTTCPNPSPSPSPNQR